MTRQLYFIVVLAIACYPFAGYSYGETDKKLIKVLIVDGYSNHDWQLTTKLIKAILEPTGLFAVSVATTPSSQSNADWDIWRPKFDSFDVIIQTYNNLNGGPDWPEPIKKDFENYVRKGGGVYIFHAANNSFANWPAYNDIIGLGWRKKDYGTAIQIDSTGKLIRIPPHEGKSTSHDARTNAVINIIANHPIHKGIPKKWKTADVEIYQYARGPAQNIQVLSYAYDAPTKMNWPMEWIVSYGKGRVFIASYGHVWKGDAQPLTMRCAGVQTIMIRALQWLAKKTITHPIPDDFPKADTISVRPELILK